MADYGGWAGTYSRVYIVYKGLRMLKAIRVTMYDLNLITGLVEDIGQLFALALPQS